MSLFTRPAAVMVGLITLLTLSTAQAASVATAYGEIEVPEAPERVVTLYEGALDAALAVDVMPVGAVTTRGGDSVARYIEAYLDKDSRPSIVGVVREVNLEAVLAARPDLILAPPQLSDEQYALLSKIAPTVVPAARELVPDTWKYEARLFGKALGREAVVEGVITEVDDRAAALSVALADAGVDGSANLVRWMPQGPLVMSGALFSSGMLTAAGFEVSDAGMVNQGGAHSDPLSLENLARLDADWLFLATLNAEGDQALEAAKQSAAFARLPVVKNDRVIAVDGQLWTSANGPLAAQAILSDIEAALLP